MTGTGDARGAGNTPGAESNIPNAVEGWPEWLTERLAERERRRTGLKAVRVELARRRAFAKTRLHEAKLDHRCDAGDSRA